MARLIALFFLIYWDTISFLKITDPIGWVALALKFCPYGLHIFNGLKCLADITSVLEMQLRI